eukprot:3033784-Rhodomonas_salina.1
MTTREPRRVRRVADIHVLVDFGGDFGQQRSGNGNIKVLPRPVDEAFHLAVKHRCRACVHSMHRDTKTQTQT